MAALELPPSLELYEELVAAYGEPHRHYHDGAHVADCLEQLDAAAALADAPAEVELALWFHDAVYRPMSSSNERESADLARAFLRAQGAGEARAERVHRLIMATEHGRDTAREEDRDGDGDRVLIVDIDLSILGRPPEVYDRFERAVRKEYRWVPAPLYRRKRREILRSFLDRSTIYGTGHFRDRYEAQARRNLATAIAALR